MHMKSWTVIATIEMMPKTQKATRAGLGIAGIAESQERAARHSPPLQPPAEEANSS